MKLFLTHFLLFTIISWLFGAVGYMLVFHIQGYDVFGAVFLVRIPLYYNQYPYQYIFIVAVTYGLVATLWVRSRGHLRGWRRVTSIGAAIFIVIVVASIPGGILWAVHDIQAGFVPPFDTLVNHLFSIGMAGPIFIWSILITSSMSYILFGYLIGYFLMDFGQRILQKQIAANNSPEPHYLFGE